MTKREAIAYCAANLSWTSKPISVTLEDGSEITVKLVDDDTALEDNGDWYGKVQSVDYGDKRPSGFDGNAQKLRARNCQVWWQPPTNVARDSESFESLHNRVAGYFLEEWSYMGIEVERTITHPADFRYTRELSAYLGGIESDANPAYLSEILNDLFTQVEAP